MLMLVAATILLAVSVSHGAESPGGAAMIFRDPGYPQIVFAAGEIRAALEGCGVVAAERPLDALPGDAAPTRIILLTQDAPAAKARLSATGGAPAALQPQGFAIRRTSDDRGKEIAVIGADPAGAMYGGLDLAETLRLGKGLAGAADKTAAPAIACRGIKFNIPLDARTPSYDDSGDAAQENIVNMWDFEFWREFLDDMARCRYNTLTLWNPHPFPSMVRVPEYPDLALEDVCVTTIKPSWKHGSIGEHMGVSQAVLENLRVVKKMSVDDKTAFWRRIMRHAKDRGIDVYFITWNVLTNSATGKHGITNDQDNPATIAYLRACVREFILAYPLLAGIGVTAGENMKDRQDEFAKEKWLWRTYGEGVLDAKKREPGRTVPFIHRIWQTSVGDVMKDFGSKYPDPFDLGFKYARARLYSSPAPPFARPLCEEMKPQGLKCWWNLRNDDIFVFRWGDPEYVREFLKNLPPKEFTAGYYVGSDGYVWGREFASTEPDSPRQLEIRKHWYSFMLWGRLGYDLSLDRGFFMKTLAAKFPEAKPEQIYDAWAAASQIIPLVNRFHWRDWDYMWSVEGCMDQRQGFHTVRDFITCPTMPGSGILTVPQCVDRVLRNQPTSETTPPQAAVELRGHACAALRLAHEVRRRTPNMSKELRLTLGDIDAMANLGCYYAAKIQGAVALAMFEKTGKPEHKESAVGHLTRALAYWQSYAEIAARQYRPQLLARTRELDWMKLLEDVKKDVEIARAAKGR
jgi:hypothetical protein